MRCHICASGALPPVFVLPHPTISLLVDDRSGEKERQMLRRSERQLIQIKSITIK